MSSATAYNETTGEIWGVFSSPNPATLAIQDVPAGHAMVDGDHDGATYIINPVTLLPVAKTALPSSIDKIIMDGDGIDSIIISGLPNPSYIIIKDVIHQLVTDSIFEFTIDTPGEYKITCQSALYLNTEYTVNAN